MFICHCITMFICHCISDVHHQHKTTRKITAFFLYMQIKMKNCLTFLLFLLPFSCLSPASLLPFACLSPALRLPVACLSSAARLFASLRNSLILSTPYRTIIALLLHYYRSIIALLLHYYRSIIALLLHYTLDGNGSITTFLTPKTTLVLTKFPLSILFFQLFVVPLQPILICKDGICGYYRFF